MWVDIGPQEYRNTRTQHIAIQTLINGPKTYTHTCLCTETHTHTEHTHGFSYAQCGVGTKCVLFKRKKSLCHVWKKKKKNHSKCFFGRKNNKLFLSLTCRSSTELTTLSQLIEHGGPEELLEKCEFNGVVVRQTHAINTLHFALTPNTHTHTHTHTHTNTNTYKVTVWGGLTGGVMCLHVCVC